MYHQRGRRLPYRPSRWLARCAFSVLLALPLPALAVDPLVVEGIVNAPVAEVWQVLTTSEGFRLLGVAQAEVDLRIGGEIRSHYDPNGRLGDENTIVNEILSFDPERMLSIRIKRAPADFEFAQVAADTWTIFYLYPLGDTMTHLTLVGLGYTDEPQSLAMRAYFERGNRWTLEQLQKRYWPQCARCGQQN